MQKENPTILVIEDNPVDISKISLKLKRFSKDVTYATTGERALSLFKGAIMMDDPFDILLTDIILPGKDGKEIIRAIRNVETELSSPHRIKIIAMSADEPSKHVLESCNVGAGCYLVKPISDEKLIKALLSTGLFK